MDYVHIADRVEQINYYAGVTLNLLLSYLILYATRAKLGSYKYLQLAFVLNDIAFATISYALQEKIITSGHTVALFMASPLGNNLHFACVDSAMVSLILVIVAYNFLYRYMAVVTPQHIRLFSTIWFPLLLVFIALCEFAVWYAVSFFFYAANDEARADLAPIFAEKYGIDAINHAILMGDYWRDGHYNIRPMTGLLIAGSIIGSGIVFMLYCSISILRHLAHKKAISVKTRRMQYALFRMLAIQTLIPFTLVHLTAAQALVLPVFGISFSLLCDWSSMFISFFPPLDAITVIMLMKDYRQAIARVVLSRMKVAPASKGPSSKGPSVIVTAPTTK